MERDPPEERKRAAIKKGRRGERRSRYELVAAEPITRSIHLHHRQLKRDAMERERERERGSAEGDRRSWSPRQCRRGGTSLSTRAVAIADQNPSSSPFPAPSSRPALPPSRRAVAPRENACRKREDIAEDPVAIRSVAPPLRELGQNATGKGDTFCHCLAARAVSPSQTTAVLVAGSRRRAFAFLVAVGSSEFLATVGAATGSARDCGCSVCCYRKIELSGLLAVIKAVSAIVEVSRPVVEAAVDFGQREMVLVMQLVYGFNFSR
ncbi:uncharacterized protein DS421_20g689480 [Arachis hypogaea]|nr:uncharacterized protein DS421_20g689480 [Arachis hypogaea]